MFRRLWSAFFTRLFGGSTEPPTLPRAAPMPGIDSAHQFLFGQAAAVPAAPPPAEPSGDAKPRDELLTCDDIAVLAIPTAAPAWTQGALLRREIAPPAPPCPLRPLISDTAAMTAGWLASAHARGPVWPPIAVGCYFAADLAVSGTGQLWIDGRLLTAPDVMPEYQFKFLKIAEGGSKPLWDGIGRPERRIDGPCVVLIGHGLTVYGHFLIEMLFRVLVARRALAGSGLVVRYLLDRSAPNWLLRILADDLDIPAEAIEFFDATRERVVLSQAIVPSLVSGDKGYHPVTNALIDELLAGLSLAPPSDMARRIFVVRRDFRNTASLHRVCRNELQLIEYAQREHGFQPVVMETLPWRQQIAIFQHAEIVVGMWGSALHTALFSPAGTKVAAIGFLNLVQSNIGGLRGHANAFLSEGVDLWAGSFDVDEAVFAQFLRAVCADTPSIGPTASSAQA